MSAQVQNKTQQPQQQQQPKTTTTASTLVPGELKNPTQPTATINTNDATMSDASNLPNAPASAAAAAEEALKEKPIPSAAEKPIVTDEDGEPPINMDEDEDVQPVSSDSDEEEIDFDAEECTFEKGNITKKILRKGDGPRPPLGSEVYVHYVGRLLDGKEFDSSRSRGTQFHFKLGKGAVIKGWDKGVAAMRKGELAELTISSEYAYGASGSPPSIPPNSTLKFEIELFSWEHRVSVTEDQGVMKELITAGSGYAKPNDGATVHIKYTAQLKDGQVFDKRYEEKAFEFKVGEDYSVPRGLDEAVKNMEKGEKSKFLFRPKYGFDTRGNAELGVPPNASLEYVIELVDFTKARETWEMKSDEKLELAKKRKTQGNELFKLERWDEAFGRYDAATKVVRHDGDLTAEQKTALNTLKEQCYNNSAACKAKLEQWSDVIKLTTDALGLEKNSVKALFRRGQAYARTNENDLAVADFKAALALDPNNEAVKKALAPVQARIRQLKEKEKKLFSGMFNRVKLVGEEEAKKAAAAAAKKPKTKKTKASTESSEPAQESSSVTESSDAASPQPKESAAPAAMDVDQSASTAK